MSQDATNDAYSEADLRNTGMNLRHDREWDYELERIVEEIEERDATKVGLQFPEGSNAAVRPSPTTSAKSSTKILRSCFRASPATEPAISIRS